MNVPSGEAQKRILVSAIIGCGIATAALPASAATFSARETNRGLLIDQTGGATGMLSSNGWFRRPGEPTFVYREGGKTVAGVWEGSPESAVVRSGTSESASLIGRIVPSWKDNQLSLTIEPAGGDAVQTTVFKRASGGGALDRRALTREAIEGSYRATLNATGKDAGWLSVDVSPEGGTRFSGDLPASIPPALAAAAAGAVEDEVHYIYGNVVDVSPLVR
jgi:hypothetical protein